jgi:peroxiredoxin
MKRILISVLVLVFAVSAAYADGYKVGDKATDFSLKNIDGTMVSMSELDESSGVILIFTCNHCPYSKLYEDRIIALDKKYKVRGYPVVAINPNDPVKEPGDSFENMIVRANEKGFTFPYLMDADQSIAKAYGATRTPHVFILEKVNSDFIIRYIGAIDDNSKDAKAVDQKFVEMALDQIYKGESPDPDFTKAIGCSIKWATAE